MPRYKKPTVESTEIIPKKEIPVTGSQGTFYKPETKGRKKSGLLDWSLDELIEYKHNGTPPARIPDPMILYKLGSIGVSMANAAALFGISKEKFSSNADWLENWQKGRAECGSLIRASIVEDALEKDNLMAKIYIDKMIGGDKVGDTAMVQVNVNTGGLEGVSTEDLIEVAFKDDQDNPDQ